MSRDHEQITSTKAENITHSKRYRVSEIPLNMMDQCVEMKVLKDDECRVVETIERNKMMMMETRK